MKRNQLTITYPSKDAPDLQQTLQHLKTTQHSPVRFLPCSNRRETPTPPTAIHHQCRPWWHHPATATVANNNGQSGDVGVWSYSGGVWKEVVMMASRWRPDALSMPCPKRHLLQGHLSYHAQVQ